MREECLPVTIFVPQWYQLKRLKGVLIGVELRLLREYSGCGHLEEHRVWLQTQWQRHVTLEEAKQDLQQIHHRLLVAWITEHVLQGMTSEHIADLLAA